MKGECVDIDGEYLIAMTMETRPISEVLTLGKVYDLIPQSQVYLVVCDNNKTIQMSKSRFRLLKS